MKKNTLLTLDEDLVELAKKRGENISQLANEALKNRLLRDESGYSPINMIKRLESSKSIHYLGCKVKEIELDNIGPINYFRAKFSNGINIIHSNRKASGKTTILRTIRLAVKSEGDLPCPSHGGSCMSYGGTKARIVLETSNEVILNRDNEFRNVKSILIDNLSLLNDKDYRNFINYLNKEYNNPQMIIALRELHGSYANVIDFLDKRFIRLPEEIKKRMYENLKKRIKLVSAAGAEHSKFSYKEFKEQMESTKPLADREIAELMKDLYA